MRVNLIIPKRGRDSHLPACLHYLDVANAAGAHDVEVLIVEAGAAAPQVAERAIPRLSVRVLHRPDPAGADFARAALLNAGLAAMRPGWDWCGLVDIDMVYGPGYYTAVERALSAAGYVLLRGRGLGPEQSEAVLRRLPPAAELAGWPGSPFPSLSQIAFTPAWLASYREAFAARQLLDERFVGWGHEDLALEVAANLLARAGLAGKAVVEGAWLHLHHERNLRRAQVERNLALAVAVAEELQARLQAHLARRRPSPAQPHLERAARLYRAGEYDQAEAALRAALARDPGDPALHLNLGEALRRAGRLDEAEAALARSIELAPLMPEAHHNLGTLRRQQGRLHEAAVHLREATRLRPGYVAAHYNLGNTMRDLGELERALAAYGAAVLARPDYPEAHLNLGATLQELERLDQAAGHYRRAAELRPDLAAAHRNLFQVLERQGETEAARASGARALALEPDNALLQLALDTLLPPIAASARAIDEGRAAVAAAIERRAAEGVRVDRARAVETGGAPPFALIYHGRDDRPLREAYAALFARSFPDEPPRPADGPPRIGFVVTPGHEGVFLKCMAGVIEGLPARELRPVVVCGGLRAAAQLRASIRRDALDVLPLPRRLDEAAAALRAAGLALLYYWEVGTDALNYFLPFCRPAPVQCGGWGWPVTSGIPAIGHFLSSEPLEPPGAEAHYSESLVRLPSLPTCYRRPPAPDRPPERSRYGLDERDHIYLCAQNLRKVHPDMDTLVGAILRRDRRGLAVFIADREPAVTAQLVARLRRELPDVVERVRVLPRMGEAEHLGLLAAADVVLDTPHYGGGANTCLDAAAAGAPVVTLPGAFHRGRWALAVARAMGVASGVAATPDEYVERALGLGTDRAMRARAGAAIRAAAPALFDRPEPARELGTCLLQLATAGA